MLSALPIAAERIENMCMAVPALLKSIDPGGETGTVMYSGNEMTVSLNLVSPKVGDYLLIHAGYAIEIVDMDTANEIMDAYKLLEDALDEL